MDSLKSATSRVHDFPGGVDDIEDELPLSLRTQLGMIKPYFIDDATSSDSELFTAAKEFEEASDGLVAALVGLSGTNLRMNQLQVRMQEAKKDSHCDGIWVGLEATIKEFVFEEQDNTVHVVVVF